MLLKKIFVFVTGLVLLFASGNYALADNADTLIQEPEKRISPFEKANLFIHTIQHSKKNVRLNNYIIGFEKPIYEGYINYGFDVGFMSGMLSGVDVGFLIKGKLPISLWSLGDIALTARGNAGMSGIFAAKIPWTTVKSTTRPRFGTFTSLSLGVEYYPIEWVGISLEIQNRFYHYFNARGKNLKDLPANKKQAFDLKLEKIIVAGLKITF